jgi:hypothetical protein
MLDVILALLRSLLPGFQSHSQLALVSGQSTSHEGSNETENLKRTTPCRDGIEVDVCGFKSQKQVIFAAFCLHFAAEKRRRSRGIRTPNLRIVNVPFGRGQRTFGSAFALIVALISWRAKSEQSGFL